MRGSALSNSVRVLLIVFGLVTIGVGCYSIKLEASLSSTALAPSQEVPSDLSKLTREELLSLQKSLKNQMDIERENYRHDQEVYKQKRTANLTLIVSGAIMLVLSMINLYLLQTQRAEAGKSR